MGVWSGSVSTLEVLVPHPPGVSLTLLGMCHHQ